MSKVPLFFMAFFLLIFIFQEDSYGFIEGFDSPPLPDFEITKEPGAISLDLSPPQNVVKRYLVFGHDSLNNVYDDTNNIVYGINSNSGFFSVGVFDENEALNLKSKGYYVIEDYMLDFHSKYLSTNGATEISQFGNIAESEKVKGIEPVSYTHLTLPTICSV